MNKGKRPMTAAKAEADEQAKKSTYRPASPSLIPQKPRHDHEPVYREVAPSSSRSPFPTEAQTVTTVVGNQVEEEIQRYLAKRYVPPTEATWTIYQANGQRERFYRYLLRIVQQPPEKISP